MTDSSRVPPISDAPPPFEVWGLLVKVLVAVLVFAALLKLDALWSGMVYPDPWLSSPRAILAVVIIEVLIAMWLASGAYPALSWLTAAVFFLVAFSVAVSTGLAGVAHCPCFGRVPASPWLAVCIDAAALVALCLFRPGNQSIMSLVGGILREPRQLVTLGLFALPVLILGLPQSWLDSPFVARLRGEQVRVSPYTADAGAGKTGEWGQVQVTIRNDSAGPVQVMGGTADCSCVTINGMPVTLASGESQSIPVRIRFVGTPGRFARKYFFYTDSTAAPYLTGIIAGRVSSGSQAKAADGPDS
ncbi:MAG: hypothetical protein ACR2FY_21435 [Pirellulaceae bacterium]